MQRGRGNSRKYNNIMTMKQPNEINNCVCEMGIGDRKTEAMIVTNDNETIRK